MSKIDTVYIHRDDEELVAESQVPPSQVASWVALGWVEGPLPSAQAERDAARDEFLTAAQERADAAATATALAEAEAVNDVRRVAELHGEQIVDLDSLPEVPPKGGEGSGLDAWLAFAEKAGIDLADDLTRHEVIEVVEAAISRSEAFASVEPVPEGDTDQPPEEG